MSGPQVVVSRRTPGKALDDLVARYDTWVWEEDRTIPRDLLLEKLRDAVGLYAMWTERIDQELLDAAPKLRTVSVMAVGVENADMAACTARGVSVGWIPEAVTEATADQAMALMLALKRRIVDGHQYVREGRWRDWSPLVLMGSDVFGKTLGFVGFGRIGQAIARRARGFNMPILYHARNRRPEAEAEVGAQYRDLDGLLSEADILVLILPLTPASHHMIDAAAIAKMKPGSVIVNVARGGVLDSQALYDALVSGHLAGAALDVTEPEPINSDSPLLTLDNCLIVPHTGTTTIETRERMTALCIENLINGIEGRPLVSCANPEVQAGQG